MKINVEIRFAKGVIKKTIELDVNTLTLYEFLGLLSNTDWALELFDLENGELTIVSGYLMVLENRMVQQWETKNIVVKDGQHLKFAQVVAGG